ncbi:hypothetical protein BH23ACT9_BH23ACT9_32030 [soil metagenome]
MQDQPGSAPPSAWAAFAHLTAAKATRYRRILGAFADARRTYVVHLRPQDVAQALGEELGDGLALELAQLADWGNLTPSPDTTRVTSPEEFNSKRLLYALTRTGEAVETGLAAYAAVLARRAELQTVALEDIRTDLAVLIGLAEEDHVDAARATATLRSLEGVFASLADNAAAFMASLTRSIETATDGIEGFLTYKDGLIGYLQRFIGDLVLASGQIAAQLAVIEQLGRDRLLVAAAGRLAADAAPDGDRAAPDGNRAAPDGNRLALSDDGTGADAAEDRLAELQQQWEGLRRWFVGTTDRPSQADLLRARARAAIPDLLETVQTLHERQSGRSDRMADYLELARWFAEAPDDRARHRLWRVAFGLHPARHLGVDAETLDARTITDVAAATPWAQAPAVHVSPRLRRTTRYVKRGPARMADRADARASLARLLTAEFAELDAARRRLATGEPVRLSDLAVDEGTFPLLLRLLTDALAAAGPGGPATTTSSDGTMRLHLRPTGDGRLAHIRTATGTLVGHDHVLQVDDLSGGGDGG